jgi:hypothetical protein
MPLKTKITVLDKLYSKFIRLRAVHAAGGCEYCGKQVTDELRPDGTVKPAYKFLETSHFIGRGCRQVRFDPDNAAGVCFTCHRMFERRPDIHTAFFRKRLGSERFEQLQIRAESSEKVRHGQVCENLERRIRELEEVLLG